MSKKLVSLFLVVLMLFSMTSAAAAETVPVTVIDMYGREITLTEPVTRVVAITPADCEILYAIGCADALVGCGQYCDYPEAVSELPVVQSGTDINVEELLLLEPQVIFMTGMEGQDAQIAQLEKNGVKVVISNANDIEGVYTAVRMIGTVMGKNTEAEAVVEQMQMVFSEIVRQSSTSSGDAASPKKKTIYFEVMPLEWGLWTAGSNTFMDEMAQMCGMENAFADVAGWQAISEEQVLLRDPDYIVLITGLGETAADEVKSRNGWNELTAVKNDMVYNADSYTMTRPAPRLQDAAIELYEFLYGIEFDATALLTADDSSIDSESVK